MIRRFWLVLSGAMLFAGVVVFVLAFTEEGFPGALPASVALLLGGGYIFFGELGE